MNEIFCIDCGKPIGQPLPGIISGWLRTDGDRNIAKAVPGGVVYGNELGYVCDDCSIYEKNKRTKHKL